MYVQVYKNSLLHAHTVPSLYIRPFSKYIEYVLNFDVFIGINIVFVSFNFMYCQMLSFLPIILEYWVTTEIISSTVLLQRNNL